VKHGFKRNRQSCFGSVQESGKLRELRAFQKSDDFGTLRG